MLLCIARSPKRWREVWLPQCIKKKNWFTFIDLNQSQFLSWVVQSTGCSDGTSTIKQRNTKTKKKGQRPTQHWKHGQEHRRHKTDEEKQNRWLDKELTKDRTWKQTKLTRGRGAGRVRRRNASERINTKKREGADRIERTTGRGDRRAEGLVKRTEITLDTNRVKMKWQDYERDEWLG